MSTAVRGAVVVVGCLLFVGCATTRQKNMAETVSATVNAREYGIVFSRGNYPDARPWICELNGASAGQLADVKLESLPKLARNTVVFMSSDCGGQGPGIYRMDAKPGAPVTKIPNTDNIRTANSPNWDAMDISPDGSKIVWAGPEEGDRYQNHSVFVINIDGTGKKRIQRDTGRHFFSITWGEAERICFEVCDVGNPYGQRPHAMRPDGSGVVEVVSEFAQNVHVGGPDGRAAMTWTQPSPYLVTMNNGFTERLELPGPRYGYSFTSWHPAAQILYGSRGGDLYRVDTRTGAETLLVAGGIQPCSGGDVGAVAPK
jgi:hypothetical protein